MSNPIVFDSGAIIALFNKREESIANQIQAKLNLYPHSPRIVYEPNLVEIFYKLIKKEKLMAPNDVRINLDHYGIEVMPVDNDSSKKIIDTYT